MDKFELMLLGIVSVLAIFIMLFAWQGALTGKLVDELEEFDIAPELFVPAQQQSPRVPVIVINSADNEGPLPSREYLLPQFINFEVNRVPIPENNYYSFIPLRKDQINVYSGSAGYYEEDPTQFVKGYLCAYAYKITGAPVICDRVELGYFDGKVVFAQGYAEDEYIGRRPSGKDFAAFFMLANPYYGILSTSPIAFIRIVS